MFLIFFHFIPLNGKPFVFLYTSQWENAFTSGWASQTDQWWNLNKVYIQIYMRMFSIFKVYKSLFYGPSLDSVTLLLEFKGLRDLAAESKLRIINICSSKSE